MSSISLLLVLIIKKVKKLDDIEGKLCSIMETIAEQGDTLEILSSHHKKEHYHNKGKAIKASSIKLST